MKPAPFEYHRPESVEEAIELLAKGRRRPRAGRRPEPRAADEAPHASSPRALVDVNGVAGLDGIEEETATLRIGASARQQRSRRPRSRGRRAALLARPSRYAATCATRHRGTVGGSLAFAAPWAELTGGRRRARREDRGRARARGDATIAGEGVLPGPNETALEPDELSPPSRFPPRPRRRRRLPRGQRRATATTRSVAAAAAVTLDDAGACTAAELVLLRVAPTP